MISGIVYFDEIIESIKDATGIENMRPYYERIKRFVFWTEREIGGGGLIVRKRLSLTMGDGYYDGYNIILPEDFIGEFSYGSLSAGTIHGNVLKLHEKGPTELDFMYMGFLLDESGNPFTTRNHLVAVVAYAVYRLYSTKVFLKQGNANMYKMYQQEYYDSIGEARGDDAFPSEEEWIEIGRTMNGATFEALTNCGMKGFTITEGSYYVNPDVSDAICTYTVYMEGTSTDTIVNTGTLTTRLTIQGVIDTFSRLFGVLRNYVDIRNALVGVSDGASTLIGLLKRKEHIVACSGPTTYTGGAGSYVYQIMFGTGFGNVSITVDPYNDGKTYYATIIYKGQMIANNVLIDSPKTFNFNYYNYAYDMNGQNAWVTINSVHALTTWKVSSTCPQGGYYMTGVSNGASSNSGTLTNAVAVTGILQHVSCPLMSAGPEGYSSSMSFSGLGVNWEVEIQYGPEDDNWLSVWPMSGNGNGQLSVIAGFSSPGIGDIGWMMSYRSANIIVRNLADPLNVVSCFTGMTFYPDGNNGYNNAV